MSRLKIARVDKSEVPRRTSILSSMEEFSSKLKPGDIILSKKYVTAGRKWLPEIVAKVTGTPWTHSGVYLGNGTVAHMSTPSYKKKLESKYRESKLQSFNAPGEGLLAVRPDVSSKIRRRAVREVRKYKKAVFSNLDLLRAGFFPRKTKGKDADITIKDSYICSGLVAAAYPTISFRPGYAGEHARPLDLVKSRKTKIIASYQQEALKEAQVPFKSKAQQRFMFAAEAKGELPEGTAKRWAHETKSFKKLPEKVRKKTAGILASEILAKHAGDTYAGIIAKKSDGPKMNAYNPNGEGDSLPETRNFKTENVVDHGTSMEEEIPMVSALPKTYEQPNFYTDKVGAIAQAVMHKVAADGIMQRTLRPVADWRDSHVGRRLGAENPETMDQEQLLALIRHLHEAGGGVDELQVEPERAGILGTKGPEYDEKTRTVRVNPGRNPATVAREVAHASSGSRAGEALRQAAMRGDSSLASGVNLGAAVAGGVSGDPALSNAATAGYLLRGGLRAGERMRATERGKQLLQETGYDPSDEEMRYLRKDYRNRLAGSATGTLMHAGATRRSSS